MQTVKIDFSYNKPNDHVFNLKFVAQIWFIKLQAKKKERKERDKILYKCGRENKVGIH